MKKFLLGIALAAASVSAAAGPHKAVDGYYMEQGDLDHETVTIQFHFYKSIQELRAAAPLEMQKFPILMAFSNWSETRPVCIVNIVDPRVEYQPEFLGHEVTHCVFGRFHNSQNEERKAK